MDASQTDFDTILGLLGLKEGADYGEPQIEFSRSEEQEKNRAWYERELGVPKHVGYAGYVLVYPAYFVFNKDEKLLGWSYPTPEGYIFRPVGNYALPPINI